MSKQGTEDRMYMEIARIAAERSHDPKHKVGCVIVTPDHQMTIGWNGTAEGTDNQTREPRLVRHESGCLHLKMETKNTVMHAELNALAKFAGSTASAAGGTLYVILSPCMKCALQAYRSKIKRVIYDGLYKDLSGIEYLYDRGLEVRRI
jgi:dCMP deaminase